MPHCTDYSKARPRFATVTARMDRPLTDAFGDVSFYGASRMQSHRRTAGGHADSQEMGALRRREREQPPYLFDEGPLAFSPKWRAFSLNFSLFHVASS